MEENYTEEELAIALLNKYPPSYVAFMLEIDDITKYLWRKDASGNTLAAKAGVRIISTKKAEITLGLVN